MYFLNKKLYLIALLLLCFTQVSKAQQELVFTNTQTGKTITAIPGSTVSIYYKGYLGQVQYVKHTLSMVTDSSIFLGLMFEPTQAKKVRPKMYTEIMLSDIVAFRKISLGRNLLKSTAQIGAIYGSFFVLQDFIQRENNTTLQNFGITLGIGLGSRLLINALFNEKPKHSINNGWQVSVR